MKYLLNLIAFLCLSCTGNKIQIKDYDFTPLDCEITGWIEKEYYPGASVAVARNGELIFEKQYGSYTPETVVYIASAGKWLAAATVASVVDQTDLEWDDLVEKWLPEFTGDPKGCIRLRHIFSHTSGIPDYHPAPKRDVYNVLADAVADILPMDTVFAPGSRFQYGGLAMQVGGRMAEVAAGKDFETIFQENIARKLSMDSTFFTPVSLEGGHSPMLGGGARTTLPDYTNFLEMIWYKGVFRGDRILSEEAVCELMADQVGDAVVLPGEYVERGLGLHHTGIYGLGLWREKVDEQNVAYQISSPGWAGAYPWINTRDSVYGFFLTHVEGNAAREDGYSPFYDAPAIAERVSEIVR